MGQKRFAISLLLVSACAESDDRNAGGIVTENRTAPLGQAVQQPSAAHGAAPRPPAEDRAVVVPSLPPELQDDGGLEPLPPRPTPEQIIRHAAGDK